MGNYDLLRTGLRTEVLGLLLYVVCVKLARCRAITVPCRCRCIVSGLFCGVAFSAWGPVLGWPNNEMAVRIRQGKLQARWVFVIYVCLLPVTLTFVSSFAEPWCEFRPVDRHVNCDSFRSWCCFVRCCSVWLCLSIWRALTRRLIRAVIGANTSSLVGVAISASLLPPAVNCGMFWFVRVRSCVLCLLSPGMCADYFVLGPMRCWAPLLPMRHLTQWTCCELALSASL